MNDKKIIDADVQNLAHTVNVQAGIQDLKTLIQINDYRLPALIDVITETQMTRGVHMSRLVRAALENRNNTTIFSNMLEMQRAVEATQKNAIIRCRFEYPTSDTFATISIMLKKNTFTSIIETPGITACPCSKEMCGVGHMQRAWLTIGFTSQTAYEIAEIINEMRLCFSAITCAFMKRNEEALKVLETQENTKFVEDVVRDAALKFPEAFIIKAKSEESIHMHDAIACIQKNLLDQPIDNLFALK
jgi:GTP cyclohydrolase I